MKQLTETYKINFGSCQLVHLRTKELDITRVCKFNAKTSEIADQILKILYEASTIIDTPTPSLGEELG